MNHDTFNKTVSKNRSEIVDSLLDGHGNTQEEILKHKPYLECSRCSNWKLAAHYKRTRHKKFLRGYTDWEILKRWWECSECGTIFDVTPPQEEHTDDANEPADDASEPTGHDDNDDVDVNDDDDDNIDDTQEEDPDASTSRPRYELTHVTSVSTKAIPVYEGDKGVVLGNKVRVPVRSAKFSLPRGTDIPKGTEVRIEREDDDVFCVEIE